MPGSTVGNVRTLVNDIDRLTAQVERLANALETIAGAMTPKIEMTDATVAASMVKHRGNVTAMAREFGCAVNTLRARPGFRDMLESAREATLTSRRKGTIRRGSQDADGVTAFDETDDDARRRDRRR